MKADTPRDRLVAHLLGVAGGAADEVAVTLYSPSQRKVACVLLAAAFGCDRRVTNIFDARDWFTAPTDDMVPLKGTLREWALIATATPEDRPGPEDFASGRMSAPQATSEIAGS